MSVWTPIFEVHKSDIDVTGKWMDRMVSLKIEICSGDNDNDSFEAILDDRDWAIEIPSKGVVVDIYMGYREVGLAYMGSYNVSEVYFEGPPRQVRLVGKAAGFFDIMKAPVVTEFENKTVAQIVQEIAGKGGLPAKVWPRYSGVQMRYLNQIQSNWHILGELERRLGAMAKVEFGELIFAERDLGQAFSGATISNVVLTPPHLASWSVKLTERWMYEQVEAAWRDPQTNERVYVTTPAMPGFADGAIFQIGRLFNTEQEAMEAAMSKANAFRRGTVEGIFNLSKGDPWIRAQFIAQVVGMRDGVDGPYIVNKATHTFTKEQGILTELEMHSPGNPNFGGGEGGLEDGQAGPGGPGSDGVDPYGGWITPPNSNAQGGPR